MTEEEVDQYAKTILGYMKLNMKIEKCDAILGLGCHDIRVGQRAAQLMLDGFASLLVFSGGYGKITKDLNNRREAELYKDIALHMGVPEDKILLELEATNIGENVRFTEHLLKDKDIPLDSLLIVTKPYYERRAYATFKKQWTNQDIKLIVTSPKLSYAELPPENITKDTFINLMVGDLQRIKEFPRLGYQIEQDIPQNVWLAYEKLIAAGYDKQLIRR